MTLGEYVEPSYGVLRDVMMAHGGFTAWNRAGAVRAVISTGGALFLMRTTRDAFRQTEVVMDLRRPRTEIRDFPQKGRTGFFEPTRVWIEDRDGKVVAQRTNPRSSFQRGRKQFHWDHLDSVYFAGYAVWNYLTTPYLLCRRDIEVEKASSINDEGETWRGLTATFPTPFRRTIEHKRSTSTMGDACAGTTITQRSSASTPPPLITVRATVRSEARSFQPGARSFPASGQERRYRFRLWSGFAFTKQPYRPLSPRSDGELP